MRTLYTADFVLPMDAGHSVIPDGALLVDGSTIVAVGPAADLEPAAAATPGTAIRPQRGRLLMPGMVNTHMHSGLLRGTAEQLPVWEWLRVHIDPMHRVLRPEEAEAAAWLCYAEAILSGTTTVVDMWRYLDGAVRAATQLGNRLANADLAELIARARAAVPGLFARRAEYLAAHAGWLPAAFPASPEGNHPSRVRGSAFGRCGND
jgi:5-methylthioadenosine/S-adenosylhomocysteine deaminase